MAPLERASSLRASPTLVRGEHIPSLSESRREMKSIRVGPQFSSSVPCEIKEQTLWWSRGNCSHMSCHNADARFGSGVQWGSVETNPGQLAFNACLGVMHAWASCMLGPHACSGGMHAWASCMLGRHACLGAMHAWVSGLRPLQGTTTTLLEAGRVAPRGHWGGFHGRWPRREALPISR